MPMIMSVPRFAEAARDVREDIGVVDLAGAGFLAARIVAGLEIPDLIPALIDVRDAGFPR